MDFLVVAALAAAVKAKRSFGLFMGKSFLYGYGKIIQLLFYPQITQIRNKNITNKP